MQELEKILEEIEAHAIEFEVFGTSDDYISVGWANDIIRRHMKNEEDILKFYYCESEDDYYIGQRVQNMYYARYADGVFTWFMSRHLPWGKRVTAPETAWKEYTYPTEPKEISFMEWIEGFISKHMNDGWIPVEERLPEEGQEVWISVKTDCVRRGMYTKCFGFGMREGFICSDGFVDINAVNAWKLYVMPEPYCPKAKVPERKQEWKERMLRNFLRGHETIRG